VSDPAGPLHVVVTTRAVHPWHGVGGLERHVYDLVRTLAGRGVRVELVTRPRRAGTPAADEVFDPTHVAVHEVPYVTFPFAGRRGTTILDRSTAYPLFGLRAGRVAASLVAGGGIDLVHSLGASGLGYALRRRRSPAVPFVLNPQGLEEFGGTGPGRAGLKRLGYWPLQRAVLASARAADVVISTDRALDSTVLGHLPMARGKLRLVPNAIDISACRSAAARDDGVRARRAAGIPDEAAVLLSVGRIEANKGFDVLARALAHMAKTGGQPAWRWVLVGDGPRRPSLEREIARSGLAPWTLLTGRRDTPSLHAWYEAAAVFVHPTLYEGSSLVTLEAMAHHLPVVATRAGGLPDKVQPGVSGWLVEPGDAAALATALGEAMSDPARLVEYGKAGARLVERHFSWEAAGDRLLDVYQAALAGSRGSGVPYF